MGLVMRFNTTVAKVARHVLRTITLRAVIYGLATLVLLVSGFGLTGDQVLAATSTFAGGSGSSSSPYLIATAEQLNAIRDNLTSHFRLVADIDLSAYASGSGWQPIAGFTGTFDGQGYTIRHLTIHRPNEDLIGLFANPTNSVQRVYFDNASVIGRNNVGVVAGTSWGLISKVYAQGKVTASDYAGGLVGTQMGNRISLSGANVSVSSLATAGGLVGQSNNAVSIDNCFAIGRVEGKLAGGLIGADNSSGIGAGIRNSFAAGHVVGIGSTYTANGFVGSAKSPQITDCYFDIDRAGRSDVRATPKSSSAMKQRTTYANWDFASIWGITEAEGYPYPLWLRPGRRSLENPEGTLNPAFASWEQTYTVDLPSSANEIAITPTAADPAATLRVNGQSLVSGTSLTLPVRAGVNTFLVDLTGNNGVVFTDYTLIVTRAPRTDASLSSLLIEGESVPGFSKDITSYTITLPYGSPTAPTVSASTTDSAAVVQINQAAGVPGTATVTVTAEDGTTTAACTIGFMVGAGTGSGNVQSPYLVENVEQLSSVRYYPDRHFRLAVDFDLTSYGGEQGWLPIGTEQHPFTGTFDGGGHTISQLRIKRGDQTGVGLFGWTGET
ncbi:MAG: cadherin-like beta sandwich domain-containing protein, partial [Bacillota bacterium]